MFYTNTCSPVKPEIRSQLMIALIETSFYAGIWSFLSGPRVGHRLANTRLARWVERKATEEGLA